MTQCFTNRYDERLRQLDHYRSYPEMLPFVGAEYDTASHTRILLIAESHYLPEYSHVHDDALAWYEGSSVALTEEEKGWINTRGVVGLGKAGWTRGQTVFRQIERELSEAGLPGRDNMFVHVSFMNCFLRPARRGQSIGQTLTPLDVEKSRAAVSHVVEVLKPDRLCFVSSLAWNNVGIGFARAGVVCEHTPHPISHWWHRNSRRGKGSEVFRAFISEGLHTGP